MLISMTDLSEYLKRTYNFSDDYVNIPVKAIKLSLLRTGGDLNVLQTYIPEYKYLTGYAKEKNVDISIVINQLVNELTNNSGQYTKMYMAKQKFSEDVGGGQNVVFNDTTTNKHEITSNDTGKDYTKYYMNTKESLKELLPAAKAIMKTLPQDEIIRLINECIGDMYTSGAYSDATIGMYSTTLIKLLALLQDDNQEALDNYINSKKQLSVEVAALKRFVLHVKGKYDYLSDSNTNDQAEQTNIQQANQIVTHQALDKTISLYLELEQQVKAYIHKLLITGEHIEASDVKKILDTGKGIADELFNRLQIFSIQLKYLETVLKENMLV